MIVVKKESAIVNFDTFFEIKKIIISFSIRKKICYEEFHAKYIGVFLT